MSVSGQGLVTQWIPSTALVAGVALVALLALPLHKLYKAASHGQRMTMA